MGHSAYMSTDHDGATIRDRRLALLVTQTELAELAGISDETLRKLEHDVPVSMRSLRRVLEELDKLEARTTSPPVVIDVGDDALERRELLVRLEGATAFGGIEELSTDALRRLVATLELAHLMIEGDGGSAAGRAPEPTNGNTH